MHSILESDGVSSDPYEILCHMGTLIIEGRTPRGAGDSTASSETSGKSAKPYNEGPHCPSFMKLYNKDTHNVHKCTENLFCIRYNNLRLHLQSLHQKSASICIEVSLGPDCVCGERRSQSTLVSGQPCKRDVILEQWTITIGQKQIQEISSQMSVMNLYQAVRSLLHFSQLTAWYMSNSGLKPAHVIHRVGVPEDSTFISDDNFVSHDFPVADVNKTVWMKISVKTLPRMEKIPSVYCPQHPMEAAHGSQEPKDKYPEPLHSKFTGEKKELLEESLPLKFQGVRKKTYETQERKRKKHIILFNAPSPLGIENCSGVEFLDGIPMDVKQISPRGQEEEEYFPGKRMYQGEALKYQGESSKAEFKKSKPFSSELSDLVKPQPNFESFDTYSCNYFEQKMVDPMIGLKSFSDIKGKSEFRTKGKGIESPEKLDAKTVMDILDDRMQISCAISGKHHCKWECEDENDLNNPGGNVEKPKRRRSLSKARMNEEETKSDSEKILHGKFKEVDCCKSEVCLPPREQGTEVAGCSLPESLPRNDASGSGKPQALKIDCLPHKHTIDRKDDSEVTPGESSPQEPSQANWESLESFKKGCALTQDSAIDWSSDSESELSDGLPEPSNPFLAAILRTTKKSKKKCDSSFKKSSGEVSEKLKEPMKTGAIGLKAKVDVECCSDLRKSPRSRTESLGNESSEEGSELPSKGFVKLKSLFDVQDLKQEERESTSEDVSEDSCSNNPNSIKAIPVPSAHDKLKFRRSLDSAAQLVFHRCSGLPLTSSPAPVRRNNSSFAFDSSLNSVSAIKSALFEPSNSLSSEDENESEGSLKSPASPGAWTVGSKQINYNSLSPLPLLGSFEESVLNGRLEPVSTVQGFTAELGASGSFCPRHLHLPVTVFFYTLGDNDKVSAPYLGHINLGKKGYSIPRSGTIQVTLFNPLRTVVKMFVVVYDLHDMPSNSHTFLRQRTLYVPASQKESTVTDKKETPFEQEDYHKYLRYLIHLRFVSGKTGRIYLHTDIRMVIFRKADEDTATALDDGEAYELRSHTHGPINPKFSPRK